MTSCFIRSFPSERTAANPQIARSPRSMPPSQIRSTLPILVGTVGQGAGGCRGVSCRTSERTSLFPSFEMRCRHLGRKSGLASERTNELLGARTEENRLRSRRSNGIRAPSAIEARTKFVFYNMDLFEIVECLAVWLSSCLELNLTSNRITSPYISPINKFRTAFLQTTCLAVSRTCACACADRVGNAFDTHPCFCLSNPFAGA